MSIKHRHKERHVTCGKTNCESALEFSCISLVPFFAASSELGVESHGLWVEGLFCSNVKICCMVGL